MTVSLWELAVGDSAMLGGFAEDLPGGHLQRLEDLGFRTGERVTCVTAPRFGAPRVYRVRNSFFSIEDIIARGVLTLSVPA